MNSSPSYVRKCWFKLLKKFMTKVGDVHISFSGLKIHGSHVQDFLDSNPPVGTILLSTMDGTLTKLFLPGFWSHGGIFVGDVNGIKNGVVHAIAEGVVHETVYDFMMHADHIVALIPNEGLNTEQSDIIQKLALSRVGILYDFIYDFSNYSLICCTELVQYCYEPINVNIDPEIRFGKKYLIADMIYENKDLKKIFEIKN